MISVPSKKAAFTLVELLVVISIILIATSILYVGSGGGGEGVKLSSAQRIVSTIAQGARGQALLKNSNARLIIYSESNTEGDREKLLRYFGIIYKVVESDADGGEQIRWKAATQGTYLPEGIFFDPDLSSSIRWEESTLNIDYPRQSPQTLGTGDEYYYYEFNPNGTATNDFVNSWLVLRAGTLKPNEQGEYNVDFSEEDKQGLRSALVLRRVGTTTSVTDPSEITASQ